MKLILTLLCTLISCNSLNAAGSSKHPFAKALLEAAQKNNTEATIILLNLEVDPVAQKGLVNTQDATGKTALMHAMITGNNEIAAAVAERHAHADTRDNEGRTALMYACIHGRTELAKALVITHANVNVQDNDGWTALMFAAKATNIEIAHLLLLNAADHSLKNTAGQTAEDIARAELTDARLRGDYTLEVMARLENMPEVISGRSAITVGSALDAIIPDFGRMLWIRRNALTMHDAMVGAILQAQLSAGAEKKAAAAKASKDAAPQRRGTNNKNRRKKK